MEIETIGQDGIGETLQPCPFCGGPARYDDFSADLYGLDMPGVECVVCDTRNFAESKALAIAAWNRRA